MFILYAFHAGLTAQVLNISCKYKSLFIDEQSFIGFCFKIPFSCFLHITYMDKGTPMTRIRHILE